MPSLFLTGEILQLGINANSGKISSSRENWPLSIVVIMSALHAEGRKFEPCSGQLLLPSLNSSYDFAVLGRHFQGSWVAEVVAHLAKFCSDGTSHFMST